MEQSRKLLEAEAATSVEPPRRAALQNHRSDPLTRHLVLAERFERDQPPLWLRFFPFRQGAAPLADFLFIEERRGRVHFTHCRIIDLARRKRLRFQRKSFDFGGRLGRRL
jgi:hypothetical protein